MCEPNDLSNIQIKDSPLTLTESDKSTNTHLPSSQVSPSQPSVHSHVNVVSSSLEHVAPFLQGEESHGSSFSLSKGINQKCA